MHPLFADVARYLSETLHLDVELTAWRGEDVLPQFLRAGYEYAEMSILGVTILLALDTDESEKPPLVVRKHLDIIAAKRGADVVHVRSRISAYNRKRLVEERIAFVVPGNQLYLPMLGIDLREHFRRARHGGQTFHPSTQATLIYALLRDPNEIHMPRALASRLEYTAMTMTRAFDELESAGIGEVSTNGRQRQFRLVEPKMAAWTKALPRLRDPVRRRFWALGIEMSAGVTIAGLSALARLSMISDPGQIVHAVSRKTLQALRDSDRMTEIPNPDLQAHEVQVWSYEPSLLARHGVVDPLSLYLSLRDTADERVEAALQNLTDALGW